MRAICRLLDRDFVSIRYTGADFNDIFTGLGTAAYDAVISGTTITADREKLARFSQPYLEFGQGVAVSRERHPHVLAISDLRGLTAGIQSGNTSDIVARKFVTDGVLAGITYYAYDAIGTALDDLDAGRIGCIIKLAPVIAALLRDRPTLAVALTVPTHEQIGIAVAKGANDLCASIDAALETLRRDGDHAKLVATWFPAPAGA